MKPRNRVAAIAGLTMFVAMMQATPCYADAIAFPDSTATGPLLLIAVLFVVLVSGVSFVLLRRIARRRVAGPSDPEAAPVPAVDDSFKERTDTPEAPHED